MMQVAYLMFLRVQDFFLQLFTVCPPFFLVPSLK